MPVIHIAGPMSRNTWFASRCLRSVPVSVSEFGERSESLVSPGEPGSLTRDVTRTIISSKA